MGSPSYSPKDCTARYTHRSDHGATTTKNRGAPRLGVSPRFTGEKRVNLPDSHGLQTHTQTHTYAHLCEHTCAGHIDTPHTIINTQTNTHIHTCADINRHTNATQHTHTHTHTCRRIKTNILAIHNPQAYMYMYTMHKHTHTNQPTYMHCTYMYNWGVS